ncbi:hypothetical protein Clopa_2690 [Clostridium pasteurianum BC1]|uniref:Uncharacterized protein n=1 Tax=Clostridium pasteurianum BC1 TaxID=86416 RepID=R4K777_CLOPA|nr:hypothetical protein Clopa_2690 [Clostridium pasteurianum BC1]
MQVRKVKIMNIDIKKNEFDSEFSNVKYMLEADVRTVKREKLTWNKVT